jgi:hypothetical protein
VRGIVFGCFAESVPKSSFREKKINNLIFSEHFQTNMILQIRVPKGRIFDVIIEPRRYQKQPKWSQKGAKVRQETFKNTSCGTGSKK